VAERVSAFTLAGTTKDKTNPMIATNARIFGILKEGFIRLSLFIFDYRTL
jgi:hypothetical protein